MLRRSNLRFVTALTVLLMGAATVNADSFLERWQQRRAPRSSYNRLNYWLPGFFFLRAWRRPPVGYTYPNYHFVEPGDESVPGEPPGRVAPRMPYAPTSVYGAYPRTGPVEPAPMIPRTVIIPIEQ